MVLGVLALTASIAFAQQDRPWTTRGDRAAQERPLPAAVSAARLDEPLSAHISDLSSLRINPALRGETGRVQILVRLARNGPAPSGTDYTMVRQAAVSQQSAFVTGARAIDSKARPLGSLKILMNAVMMEVDASALEQLAQSPDVISINPIRDYELQLSETVEYIGAKAVQEAGYDGAGVRVAVLDSGIDYTHVAFGGSGDVDEYLANDPTIIEPGTFPTERVVGGYDFVGAAWPSGPRMPDPDPLDDGPGGGHGTAVADILGGANGVAPGVDLYALKVCSSIALACNGIAIMNAMEFAIDPNGDGNTNDAVNIINLSLGADYGDPRWDDLSYAIDQASALGVLSVAAAGNGSDRPYASGTPSTVTTALSVAQTAVPSAKQEMMEVVSPADIAGLYVAVFQWAYSVPLTDPVSAPLIYGDTDGDNLNGCEPFDGDLSGYIVLVDRGVCNFSLKAKNVSVAGGEVAIIGLVTPEGPFVGADGGDRPIDIPAYMIGMADSDMLKDALEEGEVIISFDEENGLPLIGHMVSSSARGPAVGTNEIGPDIGAPGASVAAVWGTGTGTEAFGGTSGASPMAAGAAALLMQAYPERPAAEIRALLMNTGETDIMNEPEIFGGYLAPISRIGGGEVRVDDALNSPLAAWDRQTLDGSLSFGFHDITRGQTMVKRITIRNYSGQPITLRSSVEYRFDNDTNGAVRLSVPSWFTVPGRGSVNIPVHMHIRPRANRPLHEWALNSGELGVDADALTLNEYDGYIHFEAVGRTKANIHMAWHVLPRAAGDIVTGVRQTGLNWVRNVGVATSYIDTFSLLGVSDRLPAPPLGQNEAPADLRYVGVATYPVPAFFCSEEESFIMALAANTWDRQTHSVHLTMEFYLDVDEDGKTDYIVFNSDLSGEFDQLPIDGRGWTWVYDVRTGESTAWFSLVHETNSGNYVLMFCGEQIGMNAEDFFTTSMNVDAVAFDWWFGVGEDAIEGMNIVPLGERYFTVFHNDSPGFTEIAPRSGPLGFSIIDFGDQMNKTEMGVLWLYGPGAPADNEAKAWIID